MGRGGAQRVSPILKPAPQGFKEGPQCPPGGGELGLGVRAARTGLLEFTGRAGARPSWPPEAAGSCLPRFPFFLLLM